MKNITCAFFSSLARCIAVLEQYPIRKRQGNSAISMSKYKLVMLRHGEGAWNKENRFCSWVDQKLNAEGVEEARNCGKQLKSLNFEFDLVFTSILNRSIHTAWLILEEQTEGTQDTLAQYSNMKSDF